MIKIQSNKLKRSVAGKLDDLLKEYKCHGGTNYFIFPNHLFDLMMWADSYKFICFDVWEAPNKEFYIESREVAKNDHYGDVKYFKDYQNDLGKVFLSILEETKNEN